MWQQFPAQLLSLQKRFSNPPTEKQGRKLERGLLIEASWTANYVVLTVSSCVIATFGLIANSTAVIIGAMLIAPLMLPLRAFAFAAMEGNWVLLRRAAISIAGGTALAILLSYLIGSIAQIPALGSEIIARTQPTLVDLGIAIAAGAISGFAKVRRGISDALAGTAIAVALMPPLCVVGLSLSQQIWSFSLGAFLLYLTNLLGIILACKLVYIAAGYTEMSRSLGLTVAFTLLLLIPLGTNFVDLVRKTQLQAAIDRALLRQTLTVSQPGVTLIDNRVNWNAAPDPIVYLLLELDSGVEITPKQVSEVQKFIVQEMGRSLKLVFVVDEVRQITAEEEETSIEHSPSLIPTDTLPRIVKPPKNN